MKTAQSGRVGYFDIAKGGFMILLLFHHLSDASGIYGCSSEYIFKLTTSWQSLYTAFFMQAFFFVSGYCSGFKSPLATFIEKNAKSLLVPVLTFEILTCCFYSCTLCTWEYIENMFDWKHWVISPPYWFLFALFFAKIAVWLMSRLRCTVYMNMLVAIIIMCLGIYLKDCGLPNIFSLFHASTAVFFVYLGYYMRSHDKLYNKALTYLPWIYPVLLIGTKLCSHDIVSVTAGLWIHVSEIPLFIITSIAGTTFALSLCKLIGKNSVIEYIGRNSLIYYCSHYCFLGFAVYLITQKVCPSTLLSWVITIVLVVMLTLAYCTILVKLFNTKYTRVLIGKFE